MALDKSIQEALDFFRSDPVEFVRRVLGIEPLPWQIDFMLAVRDHSQIAVSSGVGTGKSACTAWLIIWYLLTHDYAKIGITGATYAQLDSGIRSEIGSTLRRMSETFPHIAKQLVLTSTSIYRQDAPEDAFAEIRVASKDNSESLRGLHCENGVAIWFVDEASSISDESFVSIFGVLSGRNAKVVMTSNPTRLKGAFFAAFHSDAALWRLFKVNYENSSLVRSAFIETVASTYGRDSSQYRVQVLGEFPLVDEETLIPRPLVEEATKRKVDPIPGPIIWGVDCATTNGGDRIAVCKRQMNHVLGPVKSWPGREPMEIVDLLVREIEAEKERDRPQEIVIDSNGVGAGVVSRLKQLGYPARGINVGERAREPERYPRLRDELWDRAKSYLEARDCKLPNQEELIFELSSPLYKVDDTSRKLKVEGKQEMRKRLHCKSPDLADAFIHSLYVQTSNSRFSGRSINDQIDVSYVV